MSETPGHLALVELIVGYIRRRTEGKHVLVLTDTAGTPVDQKPHRIGGFVPDVHAMDVPTTFQIIGEAKIASDVETEHSRLQVEAFLRHLSLIQGGTLVVAVPWQSSVTARRVVKKAVATVGATSVETIVIDEVRRG